MMSEQKAEMLIHKLTGQSLNKCGAVWPQVGREGRSWGALAALLQHCSLLEALWAGVKQNSTSYCPALAT